MPVVSSLSSPSLSRSRCRLSSSSWFRNLATVVVGIVVVVVGSMDMAQAWTLSSNVASRVSSPPTQPTTTLPTTSTTSTTRRTRTQRPRSSSSSVLLWEAHRDGPSRSGETHTKTSIANHQGKNHNQNDLAVSSSFCSPWSGGRRPFLHNNARRVLLVPLVLASASAPVWAVPQAGTAATPSTTTLETVDQLQPVVTDRIRFDVRIARQDGTFYVRDDLPDTPENQVFIGQFTVELYGQVAPETCRRFLSYIPSARPSSSSSSSSGSNNNNNLLLAEPDDDATALPTYGRSLFPSYDDATGLIVGGKIPGLQLTQIGSGTTALQYGSRLFLASLWLEPTTNNNSNQLSHVGKGLLTHARLEPLPLFGITTRTDTTQLDATHVVFGRVVLKDDTNKDTNGGVEFLQRVASLPTYRDTAVPRTSSSSSTSDAVLESAAQSVFAAQRSLFKSTAQVLGDTRLDKVYPGKLLRRVEVTRVEYL